MRLKTFLKIFIPLLNFSSISILEAKDFGTFGQTFSIEEQSLKEVLQTKVSVLSPADIERRSQLLVEKIRKEGQLFKKIGWIKEADHYRSILYDPSFSLEEDIVAAEGQLLFAKGTKINPLEQVTLDSGLLFFDGEKPEHLKWAESQTGKFKWILVAGDPLKLQQEKDRPVFFDQGGFYSKFFRLEKVPCRITQSGKALTIEEVPVKRGKL